MDLQLLLKEHGWQLFIEFLDVFPCQNYTFHEDHTGIRISVVYRLGSAMDEWEYTSTNEGFVQYKFYTASKEQMTQDFERFIKLKAFL